MAISPFNESPTTRVIDQPDSDGIDTSQIDRFRQGIEVTSPRYVGQGMLNIWAGNVDGVVYDSGFGQIPRYRDGDAYADPRSYPASNLAAHLTSSITTGITSFDMQGVIEPLDIRETISDPSSSIPYFAHRTAGSIYFNGFLPASKVAIGEGGGATFFDGAVLSGTYGLITVSGDNAVQSIRTIAPYSDDKIDRIDSRIPTDVQQRFESAGGSYTFFDDDELRSVVRDMNTVSSCSDDGLLYYDEIATTSGFDFERPVAKLLLSQSGPGQNDQAGRFVEMTYMGTDSIAFGGLLQ